MLKKLCKQFIYLTNGLSLLSLCFFSPSLSFFHCFSLSHPHRASPHLFSLVFIGWINCIPWSNPFSPTWFTGNTPLLSLSFLALISQGLMASHKKEANCKTGCLCFPLSVVCCARGYLSAIQLTFVFEPTLLVATKPDMTLKGNGSIIYLSGVIALVG